MADELCQDNNKISSLITDVIEDHSLPTSRPWYRTCLDRYSDSWWPEVTLVCIASASIVALAALLIAFHGHQVPELGLGFTFNAIISIISTISKVTLMYTISNAIGQLKWVWFSAHGPKPLFDAEIFDSASRGPQGALRMLLGNTCTSIGSVGAIATILALAFDPFVQQLVRYTPTVTYFDSEAALVNSSHTLNSTMANNLTFNNQMYTSALWSLDLDESASCPTGNCTWSQYQSLVFCTKCAPTQRKWRVSDNCSLDFVGKEFFNSSLTVNSTDDAVHGGAPQPVISRDCSITSQDGLEVFTIISITLAQDVNNSDAGATLGLVWPSFNASTITSLFDVFQDSSLVYDDAEVSRWQNETMPLVEKAFVSWQMLDNFRFNASVSEYSIELVVINGELDFEHVVSETMMKSLHSYPSINQNGSEVEYVCYQPPSSNVVNMTELQMMIGDDTFGYDPYFSGHDDQKFVTCYPVTYTGGLLNSLSSYIDNTLSGWISHQFGLRITTLITNTSKGSDFLDQYQPSDYKTFSMAQSDADIFLLQSFQPERVWHDLGRAWTRAMMDSTLNNGTRAVQGKAGKEEAIVIVQWWRLTLPVALCMSGIVLLTLTIAVSSKSEVPLWKSSVSALLYHGIDHEITSQASLVTIREMNDHAVTTQVTLSGKHTRKRKLEPVLSGQKDR